MNKKECKDFKEGNHGLFHMFARQTNAVTALHSHES